MWLFYVNILCLSRFCVKLLHRVTVYIDNMELDLVDFNVFFMFIWNILKQQLK